MSGNPSKLTLRVGDLAPPLMWQLLDDLGAAFPLTGSNPTVHFVLALSVGGGAVLDVPCVIVDPASGTVRLDWPAAAAALPSDLYVGQFIARQGSLETTFPRGPTALPVRIMDRVAVQTQRLDLFPQDLQVKVGQTLPASLQAYLTTGTQDPLWVTDQVAWSAAVNPPLLSVNAQGDVKGLAVGTALVTATLGAAQAQVTVVVIP